MPSIISGRRNNSDHAKPLSLDDVRQNPGRLYTCRDLARLGLVNSYDGVRQLVKTGRLPEPYRAGSCALWEGRAILAMLGASETIPTEMAAEHAEAA